jgi:molybdopterin molybdotransferase
MQTFISFKEALDLTLSHTPVCRTEILQLNQLTRRVLAEDIFARVDSPSIDASLRDGYAVKSDDLQAAGFQKPLKLRITGVSTEGRAAAIKIKKGQAARITTGAALPPGADVVIAEEVCEARPGDAVLVHDTRIHPNILPRGRDIQAGGIIAERGQRLTPALVGLLACAGLEKALVYKPPAVAVIATGDELIAPGEPLQSGKLYASNLIEIGAWLSFNHIPHRIQIVKDNRQDIHSAIADEHPFADAFVTCGGSWGSEKDLMMKILAELKWQGIYHRVRMSPGKPVGFGLLGDKPFFALPGGPPSNEMAFLQLALPALLKMKGDHRRPFPVIKAVLSETVRGDKDWTQFIHARLQRRDQWLSVSPIKIASRLQSMARKDALITIAEGREALTDGDEIDIQLIEPF